MKIECDTDKLRSISADFALELERYSEIVKNFYRMVDSFNTTYHWTGVAATNYVRYLKSRRVFFDAIHDNLVTYNRVLKEDITNLENTIANSKVSGL